MISLGPSPSNLGATLALILTTVPAFAQVRPYRAIDLGTPIGQSTQAGVAASGMSPDGERVCGFSVWEPYVWDRGTGMRLLQKGPGDQLAGANDVNRAGVAVGRSGQLLSGDRAVSWDLTGNITSLHQTGWNSSSAIAINESNTVLISAWVPQGSVAPIRAFYGPLGGPYVDLAPSARAAQAYDINDAGQVCIDVDGTPMRYTPGVGLQPVGPYQPYRINRIGQMAGRDTSTGGVVRYTDGVGWENLGSVAGGTFSLIGGINSFGQVAATHFISQGVSPPSFARYGYVFTEGLGFLKLDDMVDASQLVRVKTVVGISDTGEIACEGSIGPDNRAMLLEPRWISTSGTGCPGSSGIPPKAIAFGTPAAGGRVAFLSADGIPFGGGVFLVSASPASIALPGGCTLLVDPATSVVIPVALTAAGQSSVPVDVPAGIAPGSLHLQFASVDPTAPSGLFALSNAVRIALQ